ncbi:protein LAX PANICLE 2-like [Musa acuminata AAA Group]|uniref:protein LAX PANICLE 2-like n=1 Tax=Musa acuminata AAA Group TaxID=214697 RepID=UPI0031E127DC
MAPAPNLRRRHCDGYGGFFDRTGVEVFEISGLMAEKAAQSGGNNEQEEEEEEKQEAERATSEEAGRSYQGWLRLGTGSDPTAGTSRGRRDLVEMNLFSDGPSAGRPIEWSPLQLPGFTAMAPSHPAAATAGYGRTWRLRSPSPSASSLSMAPPPIPSSSLRLSSVATGSEVRVVSPPRRPQAGMWLVLRAAQNQGKQPFLRQISKSYLRMKDGRMTARALMKYLANKLGLEDGHEVQIYCRGQQVPPSMSLQQIRDQIWCSTEAIADHLLTLDYSRSG